MSHNRRNFIKGLGAMTAAIPFTGAFASEIYQDQVKKCPVSFFTKGLDGFETDFMAETLAMAGIYGFDLTVRPGGKVEPERVEEDLPRVVETGKKFGLKTDFMVTSITSARDAFASKVLKTAARSGVKHYRLGWADYDLKKGIPASLSEIGKNLRDLAALNQECGIQGGYQNHSGIRFGSALWDLWQILKDLPPAWISSQFDIRHAVVEGADTWLLALHLLKNNIGSLAVKDFTWDLSGKKPKIVSVPLGKGIVDFDSYFKTLKELRINAPVTLHIEYPLLEKEEESLPLLQKQKIITAKIRQDAGFIGKYLNQG